LIDETAARAHQAAERIADHVRRTPLRRSKSFSEDLGADVYFKLENDQATGSFKLRGATNRLLTLSDEQRALGCVAASSGNHGAAVACAMQKFGVAGIIFVPEQTSKAKVEKIRSYGGDVRFFGTDGLDTEQHAREFAESHSMFYLSPYNDEEVIAGQGTWLASPVMTRSIEVGEILDMPSEPTLSDGTAGGIEAGAVTFPLSQAVVDDWILVDEQQIGDAMRVYMACEDDVIEGAAGVAVAGLLARRDMIKGQKVAVIICGGNISAEILTSVAGNA